MGVHILDKLLSLDVGHTVNTGDTITIQSSISFSFGKVPDLDSWRRIRWDCRRGPNFFIAPLAAQGEVDIPDGENTTGLSETSLLRDTTDALLKDGRDLSGLGLGLGGVGANAVERTGSSRADLEAKNLSMTST